MATRLYNQKIAAQSVANVTENQAKYTYKGFSSSESNKNFKLYDINLVKQDLIGTVIWDMLFEPFTPDVKEIIAKDVEAIVNYDPRISVQEVQIDSTDQGMRIQVELIYRPFNITEKMSLNFDKTNRVIN